METREQFKEKQAEDYRTFNVRRAIADSMPMEPDNVMINRDKTRVIYHVDGLAGFIDLYDRFMEAMHVVPMCIIRNGTVFVGPLEWAREEDIPKAERSAHGALRVKFKKDAFGPDASGKFYVMLPGLSDVVVEIDVDIRGPGYIGSYPALMPDSEAINTRRRRYKPNSDLLAVSSHHIRWAGGIGDDQGCDVLYMFADGVRESIHELRNIIGELDAEDAGEDA